MPRVTTAIVLATAVGCGRYGFDATDVGPTDAVVLGPFGPAVVVPGLAGPGTIDDDPSLTADQLELYFKSNRDGTSDIFRATRTAIADAWGPPTKVVELSSDMEDNTPEVSADGLTIYLASTRTGSTASDVWRATRADRASTWGAPVRVAELSTADREFAASTDLAELAVVLTRSLSAANNDLFVAWRATAADPWSAPMPITELNTTGWDADAMMTMTGTEIYFSSDRPGGHGLRDIWRAARPAPRMPFGAPELVNELATADHDEDPWISPDGRTIYFSRTVAGDTLIHTATR